MLLLPQFEPGDTDPRAFVELVQGPVERECLAESVVAPGVEVGGFVPSLRQVGEAGSWAPG